MKQSSQGLLAGFAGVSIFAFTLPVTRYAVSYLDPVFVALARSILAAAFAAIALWWLKVPVPGRSQLWQLALIAAAVVVGFPLLTAHAMQTEPAVRFGLHLRAGAVPERW